MNFYLTDRLILRTGQVQNTISVSSKRTMLKFLYLQLRQGRQGRGRVLDLSFSEQQLTWFSIFKLSFYTLANKRVTDGILRRTSVLYIVRPKKVLGKSLSLIQRSVNLRVTFGCLHLNQKTNENISVFLPYNSKIGQIKKKNANHYIRR